MLYVLVPLTCRFLCHIVFCAQALLMILTAFSKFTLTMFPLALGMEEMVAPFLPNDQAMDVASSVIKVVLIVMALGVAMFVPSFSFICALVGLICTMAVSVIFPAAAHLQLFGDKLSTTEKMIDWILIVFGSGVAVIGTIATI
jgi:vesicular inhibitory amino acid transporter